MLVQVPGFTIRGADQERGLGQASENVLINGQRIANKSGGAIAEVQQVSAANVERIEIVEAAQLGIAGLSGQVANIVVKAGGKASGQFEWRPEVRAHYAKPRLLRGSVSYSGKTGPVDYTFSIKNNAGRGAFGGPIRLYDANGVNFENRARDPSQRIRPRHHVGQVQARRAGLVGRQSDACPTRLIGRPDSREDRRIRLDGDNRGRVDRDRARRLVLRRQRRL